MDIKVEALELKRRIFSSEDQLAFAKLSGDYNPQHIDPVTARRLIFGSPVVHGIHAVLWALHNWLGDKGVSVRLTSIRARFHRPIRVGDEVVYSLEREYEQCVEIALVVNASVVTTLAFGWTASDAHHADSNLPGYPERRECKALSVSDIHKASGSLQLYLPLETASDLIRSLAASLSPLQVAQLFAISRLVGMECPGFNSILTGLDLTFSSDTNLSAKLAYKTARLEERLCFLSMEVSSRGMTGTVEALLRPCPQEQARFEDLQHLVSHDEFVGQHALVVGGSRGLGEVTAKLLSAGGAEVIVTYQQGAQDARRVVDEISSGGGRASCFALDVVDRQCGLARSVLERTETLTHLYYFATPFMVSGTRGVFLPKLFSRFYDYYVIGFASVVSQLIGTGLTHIFFPSTDAVTDMPDDMGEYVSAKLAAEVHCAFLQKAHQDVTVYAPRLPRMATDQTVSVLPVKNHDPVPIILEQLRFFKNFTCPAQP